MTVPEELEALHEQFPACGTLAYADLATKMVLITNSQSRLDRHALDTLCARAAVLLGAAGEAPLGETAAQSAVLRELDQMAVFLKAPGQEADALLCLAAPDLDLDSFEVSARACLARICDAG